MILAAKKNGRKLHPEAIEALVKEYGENGYSLNDGDRVKINTERICGREEYSRMSAKYRNFVENSRGTVYTVKVYRRTKGGYASLIELEEEPTWLFWYGDLTLVERRAKH